MADPCCSLILEDLETILPRYQFAVFDYFCSYIKRVDDFSTLPPGNFIQLSETTPRIPVLEEILQRLQTPLNTGFGRWEWYNQARRGVTTLTLPQAPSKAKVLLNGVRLATPRDYSIAGTTLTFTEALEYDDHVVLKSYG